MKKGWEVEKIGDVCEVIAGQSPEGTYYNDKGKGLPFYQGKKEFTDKYLGEPTTWTTKVTKEAQAGDILMSVRAPVGPVNFATQKICIGRGLAAIRASKAIDKEFLFYFLLKHEEEIVGNAGAVFSSINKTQIENIELPIPPLPEQQRIVALLDETFAALTRVHANAERNQVNAREVFEAELNDVFVEQENIQKKFPLEELTDEDSPITYGVVKPGEFGDIRFVRGGDVQQGRVLVEQLRTITKTVSNQYKRTLLRGGELLMCLVGQPGQVAVAPHELAGANIARQVGLIRLRKEIHSEFVRYFLQSAVGQKALGAYTGGSVQQVINLGDLRKVEVPLPPLAEQRAIVQRLDALAQETRRLEEVYAKKVEDVEELRKSILQKAFNGEL